MILKQIVKLFKLQSSYVIVIPSKILNRARLNVGDKLEVVYDDEKDNIININILKYNEGKDYE